MPSSPAPAAEATPQDLRAAIRNVAAGATLNQREAAEAFELIMSGGATDAQIGALLMGMHVRGETVDEIAGAARVMRSKAVPVRAPEGAIDTCGTGGDAKGTHNISTCTAFVVAGAGVPVADRLDKIPGRFPCGGTAQGGDKAAALDLLLHYHRSGRHEVFGFTGCHWGFRRFFRTWPRPWRRRYPWPDAR